MLKFMSLISSLLALLSCAKGCNQGKNASEAGTTGAVSRYETETFQTPGGRTVTVTLIKHGTLALCFDGHWIHVDPVSGLGKPTDYAAEFPKADLILVTHEHGDHLDPEALKALSGEGTRLFLNGTSAGKLAGVEGIPAPEVLANGDSRIVPLGPPRIESSVQPGDVIVEAVPAYNTTPGREKFHPKGNGNGYVLTLDGFRVYIAGDTEDIPEMAALKDIDLAFLPVNQPYTMTPDQCVRAAQAFSPKVLIPYHFGETDLSSLPGRLPGMKVLLRQMQ